MFKLQITATFSAAHALLIAGLREPLHGHDWHVTATVEGPTLDPDGLLADFHALQAHLHEVIGPFQNNNLNTCPPFAQGLNPSAELVARHIAEVLSARLQTSTPDKPKNILADSATKAPKTPPLRVAEVRVTEAPGCAAVYLPPAHPL